MKRILPIALMAFLCVPVIAGDIQNPGKQADPVPSPTPAVTAESSKDSADGTYWWTEMAVWLLTLVRV